MFPNQIAVCARGRCGARPVSEPGAPSSVVPPPSQRADNEKPTLGAWLDKPLAGGWCMLGWVVATALFVALATLSGGPGRVDAAESVYSTWAVAHGQLSCRVPFGHDAARAAGRARLPRRFGLRGRAGRDRSFCVLSGASRPGSSLRQGRCRHPSLGSRCRSPRADTVGRLHRLVGPAGRRRGVAARLGEGASALGAGDVDHAGLSSPRVDLRLVLLPSAGSVRRGVCLGRAGLRAAGPVGRRRHPHRARPYSPSSSLSWSPRRS